MSDILKVSIRASAVAIIGLGAISFATSASATCGDSDSRQQTSWQDERMSGTSGGLLHLASIDGANTAESNSIVGMWSFKFTAGGATVDFGYVQWHSDGTELMNSGGRAPATENFCMGVWRQVAPSRYHLNHYALSYDSSGVLNARVIIKEDVSLSSSGTSYSGPFTLDVYDPKSNALLQHVAGQVTAQRVPAN